MGHLTMLVEESPLGGDAPAELLLDLRLGKIQMCMDCLFFSRKKHLEKKDFKNKHYFCFEKAI